MAQERQAPTQNRTKDTGDRKPAPKSLAIAERGIETSSDFAGFMSALIGDIVSRRVTSEVGNAACNAGGKLLKVVEMQIKYGTPIGPTGKSVLRLAGHPE